MITVFKKIFGIRPRITYAELLHQGAIIIDVRSKAEFSGGHIKGAINIPVPDLSNHLEQLKNKIIITCCASGMRSASAKNILKSNGFKNVHNGGGWTSLQNKL